MQASHHHNHPFSSLNCYNLNMASATPAHCHGYSFYYDSANGYIIPNSAYYHTPKSSQFAANNLYSLKMDKREYESSVATSPKINQSPAKDSLKSLHHLSATAYHSSLPVQNGTLMQQSSLCQSQRKLFSPVEHNQKSYNQSFTIEAILGHENKLSSNKLISSLNQLTSITTEDNSKGSYLSKKSDKAFLHKLDTKPSGKVTKSKRIRTIFTSEQLEKLENEFSKQQYMVGQERLDFAASLNLTDAQVKVWFQNRRIKWRKQHLGKIQAQLAHMKTGNDGIEGENTEIDGEDNEDDF